MTRINPIHPALLCDQHLLGEQHEISRIGTLLRNRLDAGHPMADIPPSFTYGPGHMIFFLDKGKYIHDRCRALLDELIVRGMGGTLQWYGWDDRYYKDWMEKVSDWEVIRMMVVNRLTDKMPQEPRFGGRTVPRADAIRRLR